MASWTIDITFLRRRAKTILYHTVAEKLDLSIGPGQKYGEYYCHVLFPSQEMDADGCTPVFVCEFDNGRVYNVPTESVRFVDTDEKGVIL